MKKKWIDFLNKIQKQIDVFENNSCDYICYRGHNNSSWDLTPSLYVHQKNNNIDDENIKIFEKSIFSRFQIYSGNLIKDHTDSWDILVEMRHHGLPTRLLDWTESFANALFFSLLNFDIKKNSPCIWMLNPYALNDFSDFNGKIPYPQTDLSYSYREAFIDETKKPHIFPIAIEYPRKNFRLNAQKGLFTLHGINSKPINKISKFKNAIVKFDLPLDCIEDAKKFLVLAGINYFSIYPDLDGLSKHIMDEANRWFYDYSIYKN